LEASSDASDFGFGGLIQVAGKAPFEIAGSLSDTEILMSSTAREMIGFERILQQAAERFPEILRGSAVLVIGDNQGAVSALNKFNSTAPDVAASLRKIFELCSNLDFDVVAQWRPREELEVEDALSRFPDVFDWGLAPVACRQIIQAFGRSPSVDVFASDLWHVTTAFIAPRFMPDCLAVDALHCDWRILVPAGETAWIFPPVRSVAQVIQKVREFKTIAILIVPEATTTNWWLDLLALGSSAQVEGPLILDRSTDICIPSRRVRSGTLNPAMF
jgi:hypothetical protein